MAQRRPAPQPARQSTHPLAAEISKFGQALVTQVIDAVRTPATDPDAPFNQVDAFYVESHTPEGAATDNPADTETVTVYVLSAGRFIRHQLQRNGNRLTVCVPTNRIRRVIESVVNNQHHVLIELDADKNDLIIQVQGATAPNPDDQPGDQMVASLIGSVMHSGYEITAPEPGVSAAITRFAVALRTVTR